MPERDTPIDIDDMPSIQTEDRTEQVNVVSDESKMTGNFRPGKPDGPKFKIDSLHILVVTIILFSIMMFLSYQQGLELEDARSRVAELEQRLSSDVETVSQSGVALQVKLKEQKEKLDELWTQMDKLWASAWRRNQTEINDQGKQIETLTQQVKAAKTATAEVKTALKDSDKNTGSIRAELAGISAELESLNAIQATLKQQAKLADSLQQQITRLENDNKVLKKKVLEQDDWINSINAFRQQTNKSLSSQESAIKALQAPATP